MKVGMALKPTKVKLRWPDQQEGMKNANSPHFNHKQRWLGRLKKILTSATPISMRFYRLAVYKSGHLGAKASRYFWKRKYPCPLRGRYPSHGWKILAPPISHQKYPASHSTSLFYGVTNGYSVPIARNFHNPFFCSWVELAKSYRRSITATITGIWMYLIWSLHAN